MHYQQHPLASPTSASVFLDQDKFWVNRDLERVKIKEMDQDYLMSTMIWLLKRAEELKFALELHFAGASPESQDDSYIAFMELDARKWIRNTKLFSRLQSRYTKLAATSPRKITLPLLDAIK